MKPLSCVALENVVLPAGLTEIGDVAFYGCVALGQIEIPASVTTYGREIFGACGENFVIVPEKGLTVEDESIDNQSMSVNVVPASQDYYVYDLRATLDDASFAGYFDYRTTQTDGVWQLIIDHIQNPNTSVQVTINLSGAMATVSISTSALLPQPMAWSIMAMVP
jgi:hypothetical protein